MARDEHSNVLVENNTTDTRPNIRQPHEKELGKYGSYLKIDEDRKLNGILCHIY